MNNKVLKTAFLKHLKEHDLTVYFHKNNHYILIKGDDSSKIVAVELISTTKVDPLLHGSHNNNETAGIGRFKFTIPKWQDKINFYVFAFTNDLNTSEFVCVEDEVLRTRFQKKNRIPETGKKAELTLWLMPDRCVYDCTGIGEGEWYFISKGLGGRMADGTGMDYSGYLNNWNFTSLKQLHN